jgi:hypothetical protein
MLIQEFKSEYNLERNRLYFISQFGKKSWEAGGKD